MSAGISSKDGIPKRIFAVQRSMENTLHITNGDCAGDSLRKSNIKGRVLVWRDMLYDGPRNPGWPTESTLQARARFLEQVTGGGMARKAILGNLEEQYPYSRNCRKVGSHSSLVRFMSA